PQMTSITIVRYVAGARIRDYCQFFLAANSALQLPSSITIVIFFFSSRRRHTRSVSAFLLNRSSDLIHLSTPLIRLFLLVLILLLMPTLNFLPVWFALSLLRFRLPSRLPMMFILWMVAMMVVIIPSRTV